MLTRVQGVNILKAIFSVFCPHPDECIRSHSMSVSPEDGAMPETAGDLFNYGQSLLRFAELNPRNQCSGELTIESAALRIVLEICSRIAFPVALEQSKFSWGVLLRKTSNSLPETQWDIVGRTSRFTVPIQQLWIWRINCGENARSGRLTIRRVHSPRASSKAFIRNRKAEHLKSSRARVRASSDFLPLSSPSLEQRQKQSNYFYSSFRNPQSKQLTPSPRVPTCRSLVGSDGCRWRLRCSGSIHRLSGFFSQPANSSIAGICLVFSQMLNNHSCMLI